LGEGRVGWGDNRRRHGEGDVVGYLWGNELLLGGFGQLAFGERQGIALASASGGSFGDGEGFQGRWVDQCDLMADGFLHRGVGETEEDQGDDGYVYCYRDELR
jgi:hypothetical protein